jgi:hypothetical protein
MRRAKPKKLADAAGGLESAKERHQKYHTPQSYRNNPMLSNLFYKPRFIYPNKFARKFRRKGKYYYANTGT